MALVATKLFEISTRKPSIIIEVFGYVKLAADATGSLTRTKGRKIRRVVGNSNGTAVISGNNVNLSGLSTASTHSLNGMVAIEVERI
jgi:hypothetical protein